MEDEEFYRLFIDWLPFETNMGITTLGKHCSQEQEVRHVPSLDLFPADIGGRHFAIPNDIQFGIRLRCRTLAAAE